MASTDHLSAADVHEIDVEVELKEKEEDKSESEHKHNHHEHEHKVENRPSRALSSAQIDELRREAENDKELGEISDSRWFFWYMNFIWVACGAVFLWYLSLIVDQHLSSVATPSSTILITDAKSLPLPRVIICNWNQNGAPGAPIPTGPCPECNITLVSCQNLNTSEDCTALFRYSPIQTFAGLFSCYTFNDDPNNLLYSATTGYSGSFATIWQIQTFNATDPPTSRAGLQSSYINNDGVPVDPLVIYDEYRFSQPSQDNFFSLQLVTTIHNELSASDPNFNVTRYDTVNSAVSLLVEPQLASEGIAYVGISFAFQSLSSQQVIFDTAYTINNLFGDFAGMVGTLMGLDAIKVSAAMPLIFLAMKYRVIKPLADHFNG